MTESTRELQLYQLWSYQVSWFFYFLNESRKVLREQINKVRNLRLEPGMLVSLILESTRHPKEKLVVQDMILVKKIKDKKELRKIAVDLGFKTPPVEFLQQKFWVVLIRDQVFLAMEGFLDKQDDD